MTSYLVRRGWQSGLVLLGVSFVVFLILHLTGDPALLAETVRAEVRTIDRAIPIYEMRTMSALRSETVSMRRFVAGFPRSISSE